MREGVGSIYGRLSATGSYNGAGHFKRQSSFFKQYLHRKKIVAIANLVYTIFLKRHGYPSETFRKVTPFQQFQLLTTQDSGKLWCGNVAQIFAYFCWAESITCRSIEILKPNDHHVVNECYLPEIKKWILVDVPHNLFLVKDSAGSHLDLQTFGSLVDDGKQFQSYQHVSNKITVQSALKMKDQYFNDYYLTNYQQAYYHTVGGQDIYSVKNKVRRYFLPHSWYKIYRERAYSNTAFYIKQILFFLWLVSILVLLSFLIKNAIMIFSKRGR